MTGIGPVISIAVIVLPIMLSLGVPSPIALFSFMGSIMAGIFGNIVNFKQYHEIFKTTNESYASITEEEKVQIIQKVIACGQDYAHLNMSSE